MNALGWCGSGMNWMWVFPALFVLMMLGVMVMFWRRGFLPWCGLGHYEHETPRQILDRRYSSGDITKEQYDEMRHSLA